MLRKAVLRLFFFVSAACGNISCISNQMVKGRVGVVEEPVPAPSVWRIDFECFIPKQKLGERTKLISSGAARGRKNLQLCVDLLVPPAVLLLI